VASIEPPASPHAPEQPILWLGMSGFSPEQRSTLEAALDRPGAVPRWRACAFGDADAWWVNGSKTQIAADGNLRVTAGLPTERALKLDLAVVDRPVAFSTPLACEDFEPACTFDPQSAPTVHAALLQFESWLWLTRAEFVLGALIIRRGSDARRGVWQVSHGDRLLAVLDFQQQRAAIMPRAHPVDLWDAIWQSRPLGAHDFPETFVQATPAQLAWAYVRRTDRDMLPERYRTDTIYYRRVPGVPMRWLRDSQLLLLRELSAQPSTLALLRQLTGMSEAQVCHDLTCLYYAGAITTTRAKAAVTSAAHADVSQPHTSGPELESLLRHDSHPSFQGDMTAPALLEHRRGLPPPGRH
jgi:hypothetical protein